MIDMSAQHTHQCSSSLACKSKECGHAKPHAANGCDCSAPCGQWPNKKDFQPFVKCIPVEQVKPLEDCPDCGASEEKGHHQGNCVVKLKQRRDKVMLLLDRYGQHDAVCLIRIDPQVGNCDCGFDEAIAKAGEA